MRGLLPSSRGDVPVPKVHLASVVRIPRIGRARAVDEQNVVRGTRHLHNRHIDGAALVTPVAVIKFAVAAHTVGAAAAGSGTGRSIH